MTIFSRIALALLFFALPTNVFANGFELCELFGNAPFRADPNWADGVIDLVNVQSRIYSYWRIGEGNFFYRGNAQALDQAITQFAQVTGEGHQFILLPGEGATRTFEGTPISFGWHFAPQSINWSADKKRSPKLTIYINAAKPRALDRNVVGKCIDELGSDSFQAREKARRDLEKMGHDAKPFLRAALNARPTLEQRRRLETLLEKLPAIDVSDLTVPKGITVLDADNLLAIKLQEINESDPEACAKAMQESRDLAIYSDGTVAAMTAMLDKGKNEWVRRVAAACLARAGIKAQSALPSLRTGWDDPDINIRRAFQSAIEQLEKAKENPEQEKELRKKLLILEEIRQFKKEMGR